MKVLLIEPDTVMAQTIQCYVETQGVAVAHARDAQTAIQLLDEEVVDAIVLEPRLIGQNGVAFLHELHSYDDLTHLPVVIYSMLPGEVLGLSAAQQRQFGIINSMYKPKHTLRELTTELLALQPANT